MYIRAQCALDVGVSDIRRNNFIWKKSFMGKILKEIDIQLIRPRVYNSYFQGLEATKDDIETFYEEGEPKRYERTGNYRSSPNGLPPSGKNGDYTYTIMLEPPSYDTGTHDGLTVLTDIQNHGHGVLGKENTWDEAIEDIKKAIKNNFN